MPTQLTTSRPHADLTDDVLLQQASDGDQAAFEALVKRYSASLFHLISSMVWDEHLAHDVMQHVFFQSYNTASVRPSKRYPQVSVLSYCSAMRNN